MTVMRLAFVVLSFPVTGSLVGRLAGCNVYIMAVVASEGSVDVSYVPVGQGALDMILYSRLEKLE